MRYSKDIVEAKRAQTCICSSNESSRDKVFGYHRNYLKLYTTSTKMDSNLFKIRELRKKTCYKWRNQKVADIALSRPNLPFTQWSLSKLRDYVIERGIVESISIEWFRQILKERGIKERQRHWKNQTILITSLSGEIELYSLQRMEE